MPFFLCAFLQSFSTFLVFFARMGKRFKQRDKILCIFLLLSNCPFFLCLHPTRDQRCLLYLYFHVSLHPTTEETRDQFWFLGNCPPTPPQTQHFAQSEC